MLMCMNVLSFCVYAHCACLLLVEASSMGIKIDPLGLELKMVVGHHTAVRDGPGPLEVLLTCEPPLQVHTRPFSLCLVTKVAEACSL